ncbi:Voltage-dependent calcium channel gamma-5 subunit, partial [Varanus komodoensis]
MPMNVQLTSESTVNVLSRTFAKKQLFRTSAGANYQSFEAMTEKKYMYEKDSQAEMIRSATPFPLVSLFFMFIGFILSNIGHIRPHRTILAFVSGIFFILSGLSLVVGLVLYISSINDEMLNRTKDSETYFTYRYGWSFAFSAISFLLTESAGVMSVYLFMKRYTAEEMYRPHPGFYRPRLSNCSDYSGQFLHPDAWVRGRSPSDISSDASLQMNSNYPALLKCPDYDQMSSSPC